MSIDAPLTLLGGRSPRAFMRQHWQKRPLVVRQAWPQVQPPLTRQDLFSLAAEEDVESRLLTAFDGQWRLKHGPFGRRQLPALNRAGWTLLVQGVDLHAEAAHRMLAPFRFVSEACLDDLMVSWASDGGGVGPHIDAYDVFLLQVQGRRRWRFGPVSDRSLVPGLPVRILANFQAEQEVVLEPGDMLYLPPLWGHDGVAVGGDCMTCSIGFRAPRSRSLARDLLQGLADDAAERLADDLAEADDAQALAAAEGAVFRDARMAATESPGSIPESLRRFARQQLTRALNDASAFDRILGIWITEPKPVVSFKPLDADAPAGQDDAQRQRLVDRIARFGVCLDRRSRMAYGERHLFLNGEAFVAAGRDARLMRALADRRVLSAADCARLSGEALDCVVDWVVAGWLHPADGPESATPGMPASAPASGLSQGQ